MSEEMYLPRWSFSAKMIEPKIATMTMQRGLNAVTNTGPCVFITSP